MSGRGVRRFPCDYESGSSGKTNHFRRQSGRLQDHPTRGAIEGTQCRAEERANSRGEDSSTHNYKDFVNDLIHHFRSDRPSREYDGSTPMQYFQMARNPVGALVLKQLLFSVFYRFFSECIFRVFSGPVFSRFFFTAWRGPFSFRFLF